MVTMPRRRTKGVVVLGGGWSHSEQGVTIPSLCDTSELIMNLCGFHSCKYTFQLSDPLFFSSCFLYLNIPILLSTALAQIHPV
jgi:hypothetical protein